MRSFGARARAFFVICLLITGLASGLTSFAASAHALGEPTTRELLEKMGIPVPGAPSQRSETVPAEPEPAEGTTSKSGPDEWQDLTPFSGKLSVFPKEASDGGFQDGCIAEVFLHLCKDTITDTSTL